MKWYLQYFRRLCVSLDSMDHIFITVGVRILWLILVLKLCLWSCSELSLVNHPQRSSSALPFPRLLHGFVILGPTPAVPDSWEKDVQKVLLFKRCSCCSWSKTFFMFLLNCFFHKSTNSPEASSSLPPHCELERLLFKPVNFLIDTFPLPHSPPFHKRSVLGPAPPQGAVALLTLNGATCVTAFWPLHTLRGKRLFVR